MIRVPPTFALRVASFLIVGAVATTAWAAQATSQPPAAMPIPAEGMSLGILFNTPPACTAAQGICVMGVRRDGAADRAGLRPGDVLRRVNNIEISSSADVTAIATTARVGDNMSIVVDRQGTQLTLTLDFGESDLASRQDQDGAPPSGVLAAMSASSQLPYEILPAPTNPELLIEKLGAADTAIWLDADVLSIVRRDSGEDVRITGTFQQPMKRLAGSDIWTLQVRKSDWDQAFFSANFHSRAHPQTPASEARFRGDHAPAFPSAASSLHGHLIKSTLHSVHLDEAREVTIYIPPHAPKRGLRALFMADGQNCESYARIVEPLIESGRTAPFAIIGVHSAPSSRQTSGSSGPKADPRSREYISLLDPETAAKHMKFFIEEVLPWASREYGVSRKRADRAVFGFSNGAVFAVSAAVEHGDLFGHALPFSVGVAPGIKKPSGELPRFYFAAGDLEPLFLGATTSMHERVRSWGGESTFTRRMSGHDHIMWEAELAAYMPRVFPPRR